MSIDVQLRKGKNTLFLHSLLSCLSRTSGCLLLTGSGQWRGEIPHLDGGCLPAYPAPLTLLLGLPTPHSGLSLLYL